MESNEALNELKELISHEHLENVIDVEKYYDIIEKDLDKLEQILKIEEDLCIDLITLFKFFKKELVFKTSDDGCKFHACPNITEIAFTRTRRGWALKLWGDYYYLKDFNKTFRFSTKTGIGRYWAKKNGGTEF